MFDENNNGPADIVVADNLPVTAPALSDFAEAIGELQRHSRSENTMRAYRSDLRQFEKFCKAHGQMQVLPVTPFVVASFVSWMDQRGLTAATIGRRLSALSALHVRGGYDDPTKGVLVTETMEGLRRSRASRGERPNRVQPVDMAILHRISKTLTGRISDRRDWAIMLLGFSGLLRRSEIAALNMDDVEMRPDGIVLHIRRSKTDQTGEGDIVGIPCARQKSVCPVLALKSYLEAAGHQEGPLFRNHSPAAKQARIDPRVVARAVKRLAKRTNLDPSRFAGHSLRAGGATEMAQQGVDLGLIVNHGRWQSPQTVSRHYIRPATALGKSNPMRRVLEYHPTGSGATSRSKIHS
jgi:site-specific recombinase XerD